MKGKCHATNNLKQAFRLTVNFNFLITVNVLTNLCHSEQSEYSKCPLEAQMQCATYCSMASPIGPVTCSTPTRTSVMQTPLISIFEH